MDTDATAYEKYYPEQEDVIDWSREATGVIQDIVRHVAAAQISTLLKPTDSECFINLRTLDGTDPCVKLNGEGLQIVGDRFDSAELEDDVENVRYETPYSLLSAVSPAYVESFGSCLAEALSRQLQERLIGNGTTDGPGEVGEGLEGPD
uniref:GSKIP domain-containing protein n=1 Tax=Culex tarsalis TaxID=7177 RepID=A0A1Q3FIG6_CULTA